MPETNFDTIILGGGVIGCAIAYELSKNGQKVALLEKNIVASGASGVSAAMLEAQLEAHRGEPFLSLALASRELFPNLWKELKDLTGIDFQYEKCGILRLAGSAEEREELIKRRDFQKKKGLAVQWLKPAEIEKTLPQLEGSFTGAILHLDDGQVNASRLTSALAEGAKRHGAQIFENTEALSFERWGDAVLGVVTKNGIFHAKNTVVAGGAWSPILGKTLGLEIPVEPLRGQLVVYEASRNVLPYPVFLGSRYIVPKIDGFLLAGTTTEEVGFDDKTTPEAIRGITEDCARLLPLLKSKTVKGATAGLRPHSPDELPILGAVPGLTGILLATGHYRNGILLAPITAQMISSLILNNPSPADIAPYSLSRFQKAVSVN